MNIFLIGIKGSGMSALALLLHQSGHKVSGSDINKFCFTQTKLVENKITIHEFEKINFLNEKFDEIIIGNAFSKDHPEVSNAILSKIPILKYGEKINEIAKTKKSIAISGTNGKTTTTGLMSQSFIDKEPNYLIGDGVGKGNSNSDIFIFEACEYKETFLEYHPDYLIINNIEMDHPDFFKNEEHVVEVFQKFANQSKILIANGDDLNVEKIVHQNKKTFGQNSHNDLIAQNVQYKTEGIELTLTFELKNIGTYTLPFFGQHMLYNALGVILVNLEHGRDIELIIQNLKKFTGVQRRFSETVISIEKNITLIDDYAHHPTSIELTLKGVRQKYPNQQIITIFQPHTYSRMKKFSTEFAKSLLLSDKIILAEIFGSARETNQDVTINMLEEEVKKINENKLLNYNDLNEKCDNTIFCLLGAGDIDVLYKEKLIQKYSRI